MLAAGVAKPASLPAASAYVEISLCLAEGLQAAEAACDRSIIP